MYSIVFLLNWCTVLFFGYVDVQYCVLAKLMYCTVHVYTVAYCGVIVELMDSTVLLFHCSTVLCSLQGNVLC